MKRFLLLLLMASNFVMAGNSERQESTIDEVGVVAPQIQMPLAQPPQMQISKAQLVYGVALAACSVYLFKKAFAQGHVYPYNGNTAFNRTVLKIWAAGYAAVSALMFYQAKQ